MSILVMGVSGSGKSTIGAALAVELGMEFVDADSLHSLANVAKMAAGAPLDDLDRAPWLDAVAEVLAAGPVVVACSALKRLYRDHLRAKQPALALIYIHADAATLTERLTSRESHFMPVSLLDSQLRVLEPPTADEHPIELDSRLAPSLLIETALTAVRQLATSRNPLFHHRTARNAND